MSKKILCVIVLMFVLVGVLTSCGCDHEWTTQTCEEGVYCTKCGEIQLMYGYGHTFGEWTTITERTCTQTGIKERVCACGEKETQTLSSGHNFADWGICLDCSYGWVTINLPETPLIVCRSDLNAFKITEMSYQLGKYDRGYTFKLIYSGEKVIDNATATQAKSCRFRIKLLDSNGYVIFSDYTWTDDLSLGDKIKNEEYVKYSLPLDQNQTYTLIISDY